MRDFAVLAVLLLSVMYSALKFAWDHETIIRFGTGAVFGICIALLVFRFKNRGPK